MNNKLIFFLLGTAVGAAAGALGAGLYFKKQAENAVFEIQEMYRQMMKDAEKKEGESDFKEVTFEEDEKVEKNDEKLVEMYTSNNTEKPRKVEDFKRTSERTNYNSFSALNEAKMGLKRASEEDESEDDDENVPTYVVEEFNENDLRIGTDSDQFDINNGYEKVQATYYAENDICIDDDNEEVIDISRYPGDFASLFSKGDEAIYIHDPRISTDFEITYDEGSFIVE